MPAFKPGCRCRMSQRLCFNDASEHDAGKCMRRA
jgi:hypothetical protein